MAFFKAGLYDTQNGKLDYQKTITVTTSTTFFCNPSYYFDYTTKRLWLFTNVTAITNRGRPSSYSASIISYSVLDLSDLDNVTEYAHGTITSDTSNIAMLCASCNDSNDWSNSRRWFYNIMKIGDYFYFPWKKYQLSKNGTSGFDGVCQLSYSPSYQLDMFIRYRYKNKHKDFTPEEGEKVTLPYVQQKWRYQLNYTPMDELMLKTTVDIVHNGHRDQKASQGILIGQSGGYKFRSLPLQLDAGFAWFQTDDYASRISMYEKGLLYSFSIPSFYGKGERYTFNARYELNEHIIFQAKYALTHYRDREVISSGLEQINGNTKSDLYLQLRLKF